MIRFLFDFFWFPFAPGHPSNKFGHVMQFVMKDFSLYFWVNPSRRSLIKFPFALLRVIWQKTPSETFGSSVQLLFFCILCWWSVLGYSYRTQQDPRLVVCDYVSLCRGESGISLWASHGSANEDSIADQLVDNTGSPEVSVPEDREDVPWEEDVPTHQQPGVRILDRYRDAPLFTFWLEDKVWIQTWRLSGTLVPAPSWLLERLDQTLAALASAGEWTAGTRLRLREDLGYVRDALVMLERDQILWWQEIQPWSWYTFFLRNSGFLDPDRSLLSRSAITRLQRTMALLESRWWTPWSPLSDEDRAVLFRLLESVVQEIALVIRWLGGEWEEGRARDELVMILALLRS